MLCMQCVCCRVLLSYRVAVCIFRVMIKLRDMRLKVSKIDKFRIQFDPYLQLHILSSYVQLHIMDMRICVFIVSVCLDCIYKIRMTFILLIFINWFYVSVFFLFQVCFSFHSYIKYVINFYVLFIYFISCFGLFDIKTVFWDV